jgi:hypothetical protein
MFIVCNDWNECVCVYVCISEAANFVSGEVVRVEQMFINLGKCISVARIEVKYFFIVSKHLTGIY